MAGRKRLPRTIALHDQVLATVRARGVTTTQQVVDDLARTVREAATARWPDSGSWPAKSWRVRVHESPDCGMVVPWWGNVYGALRALEAAGEVGREAVTGPVPRGGPVMWVAARPAPELPAWEP